MDNLSPILFIAAFIIIAIRQDRKNKRQQAKRLEEMQREMNEQAQEQSNEPLKRPTAPRRHAMLTPEQIAEKHAELMRRHNEQLAEIQRRQVAQMNDEYPIEMSDLQGRVRSAAPTSKPANSAKRVSQTAKKAKTPTIPTPTVENATTTANNTSAEKAFDFDIERAVVEAEILKPKYLDY